jgi:hypothetical protein
MSISVQLGRRRKYLRFRLVPHGQKEACDDYRSQKVLNYGIEIFDGGHTKGLVF